jgi:hypothetical protein
VLDGTRYDGPRFLGAGRHTLAGTGAGGTTIVWWRALKAADAPSQD